MVSADRGERGEHHGDDDDPLPPVDDAGVVAQRHLTVLGPHEVPEITPRPAERWHATVRSRGGVVLPADRVPYMHQMRSRTLMNHIGRDRRPPPPWSEVMRRRVPLGPCLAVFAKIGLRGPHDGKHVAGPSMNRGQGDGPVMYWCACAPPVRQRASRWRPTGRTERAHRRSSDRPTGILTRHRAPLAEQSRSDPPIFCAGYHLTPVGPAGEYELRDITREWSPTCSDVARWSAA